MRNQKGQTLLEIIIALGIVITAITAILTLTTSGVASSRQSQDKLIAANLAREGVEVVRNIRDSNWLSGVEWSRDIFIAGQTTLIPVFDDGDATWSLQPATDQTVYLTDSGVYAQGGISGSKTPSGFSRVLTIDYDEQKHEITATCTVSWKEKKRSRSVEVVEVLYDWR